MRKKNREKERERETRVIVLFRSESRRERVTSCARLASALRSHYKSIIDQKEREKELVLDLF